jgi:hypothetical protein
MFPLREKRTDEKKEGRTGLGQVEIMRNCIQVDNEGVQNFEPLP